MKTSFKMGAIKIKVLVEGEADINIDIANGIETSFEGSTEEVIAMYKETALMVKDIIASQNCCGY